MAHVSTPCDTIRVECLGSLAISTPKANVRLVKNVPRQHAHVVVAPSKQLIFFSDTPSQFLFRSLDKLSKFFSVLKPVSPETQATNELFQSYQK